MANRPVYIALKNIPYVQRIDTEFKFFPGFSEKQKRLSINSLHKSFTEKFTDKSVLEISSKSEIELGVKLSAFNLQISLPNLIKKFLSNVLFKAVKFLKMAVHIPIYFLKLPARQKKIFGQKTAEI